MKTSVNFSDFCDAFCAAGRNDSFSYDGKRALFDWLEQYEEDCGTEVELDVIALCCEFTEYDSAREAADVYDWSLPDSEDEEGEDPEEYEERCEQEALEYLQHRTHVIEVKGGGVIIHDF